MKLTILAFVLIITIANAQNATSPAAVAPAGRCYKKVTKCCWKFGACGVQVGSVLVPAKCPVKTCGAKCYDLCKPKVVAATTRKCYQALEYTKKCFEHPWLRKICVKYPSRKENCAVYNTSKLTMACGKVCPTVCSIVIKPCKYYKVFNYPKFCPTLECEKEAIQGNSVSPKVVVSPIGKFIKKSNIALNK